jgi:hypothetical protein
MFKKVNGVKYFRKEGVYRMSRSSSHGYSIVMRGRRIKLAT